MDTAKTKWLSWNILVSHQWILFVSLVTWNIKFILELVQNDYSLALVMKLNYIAFESHFQGVKQNYVLFKKCCRNACLVKPLSLGSQHKEVVVQEHCVKSV